MINNNNNVFYFYLWLLFLLFPYHYCLLPVCNIRYIWFYEMTNFIVHFQQFLIVFVYNLKMCCLLHLSTVTFFVFSALMVFVFLLQSGARINISDASCPERIVTITGTTDQIVSAYTMICKRLEEVTSLCILFTHITIF